MAAESGALNGTLINKKHVRNYLKLHGKRVSGEAMSAINEAVRLVLDRALNACRYHKTIKRGEIEYALVKRC